MRVKKQLAGSLTELLDKDLQASDIEIPVEAEHGDLAFPVMGYADDPRQAAEGAVEELEELDIVDRVEVAGPGYINFFLDREKFAEQVAETLESENMGVEQKEGKLLLEFSSPNVAKPMHVGHFRNNALGDSLQRIFRFVGYEVTSENYIGDWGTQYGKLIHAFKEFGSEQAFEQDPMEHMFELYVKFHEEMADNEEMEEKGREWAKKIEERDAEAMELWERFRDASIQHHKKDYERMGIEFDRITGESKVVDGARELIEEKVEEGLLEKDEDGSVFMEFDDLPGAVLLKADGSTLYITRDLYNLHKRNMEGFDYNLYLVGSEQELHFRQVFRAAEELGLDPEGSEHVSYGLLNLPEGGMSSREGRIIRLSDLLDEAEAKAAEKLEEEGKELDVAEEVGIGAAKYANLKVGRNRNIEFQWDQVLSFEGDSGPYLQYSNTRAKSILEKADAKGELTGELNDAEHALVKKLAEFPESVESAAGQREPAKLANYLSQLCEQFNSFYHGQRVIDAGSEGDKKKRLELVDMFVRVTGKGLELLGIEPLEEM